MNKHLALDPTKRSVRTDWYWPTVARLARPKGQLITLSSGQALDAITAEQVLKIPRSNILAVDFKPQVLAWFTMRFPGARTKSGDIFDILDKATEPYSVIDLDLCCPYSMNIYRELLGLRYNSLATTHGTVIGISFSMRNPRGFNKQDALNGVQGALGNVDAFEYKTYQNKTMHCNMLSMIARLA